MKWASTIATEFSLQSAVENSAARLFKELDHQEPDVVFVFVKTDHSTDLERLPALLREEFATTLIFGCVAEGAIGSGKEVEEGYALALTGAVLPGVKLSGVHLNEDQIPPAYGARSLWELALLTTVDEQPSFIVLADPFSFPGDPFLRGMDRAFPNACTIGGIASGVRHKGECALYLNDTLHRSGVIVLALSGNIEIDAIVAQGCRPVGDPMFVTAVHENLVRELDGRSPRDVLSEVHEKLPAKDQELFSTSLFLGVAMESRRNQYAAGDFLVRNILGMDPQSGALWIDAELPINSVVQLHLRDAVTSAQDLERMLLEYAHAHAGAKPGGALLFSCLGRGEQLYGQPDHDSDAFRRLIADVPIGGFFCNGEIGPVKQTTYLHGHTSAFAVFKTKANQ